MFEQNFDRKEVLHDLELQLLKCKGQVIHNDYDGLISGLFVKRKLNLDLKGIFKINSQSYYKSNLALVKTESISDYLFVDCSIINKCTTIDHHSIVKEFYTDSNFNCNKYTIYNDIMIGNNMSHKNPTGCICWLLYLFGEDISTYTYNQKLLIVLADSLYDNYNKYKYNCQEWLTNFNQESLIEVLESPTLLEDIENIKKEIGIVNQGYQLYTDGQWISWGVEEEYNTQEVLNNISDMMGWERMEIPVMELCLMFTNHKYYAKDYEDILKDDKRFTSAIRSTKNGRYSEMYVCRYNGQAILDFIKY